MNTLKQINKHLLNRFGIEIERVSDIDCFHTRRALAGIKFILRGANFDEDFETFKDVKTFIKTLTK
mgnify:CR=1 FL=1|tara:strand:- start:737 stop:934 length:198 start_codon:yes stop_codon:yes gene_type:complete